MSKWTEYVRIEDFFTYVDVRICIDDWLPEKIPEKMPEYVKTAIVDRILNVRKVYQVVLVTFSGVERGYANDLIDILINNRIFIDDRLYKYDDEVELINDQIIKCEKNLRDLGLSQWKNTYTTFISTEQNHIMNKLKALTKRKNNADKKYEQPFLQFGDRLGDKKMLEMTA